MYSARLLDYFQNPRNVGEISDADAVIEMENPACGDILKLTLKVNDGRITAALFKAKGCVASIACGSALTELIIGQTLTAIKSLGRNTVAEAVDGLPQASSHAAQLAIDALSAALNQIKS